MKKTIAQQIADYWENPKTISIIDSNLHQIEMDCVKKHLSSDYRVLDIGCGSGDATKEYSRTAKEIIGFEKSKHLAKLAKKKGLNVVQGDILDLNYKDEFDVVITQRTLINLEIFAEQGAAIDLIYFALKKDGLYIMIENTFDSFNNLNDMRMKLPMEAIPLHWHNTFFDRQKLFKYMENYFDLEKEYDFSLYYFLTRIFTQMFAKFEGYGAKAKKDPIFNITDKCAKKCYDLFKDNIKFDPNISTIQCFVWRKK